MRLRKTPNNSVLRGRLRKRCAETESNHRRSPTPVANESLPDTVARLRTTNAIVHISENNTSDKSYRDAQHKRIVVQTQLTQSIIANRLTAGENADEDNGTESSDVTTDNSDDTSSELSSTKSTDTNNSTDTEEISFETTSKRRKHRTPCQCLLLPSSKISLITLLR
jgi:hypothetical protein